VRTICSAPVRSSAEMPVGTSSKSFLLGHSSIRATERYLGSEQEIAIAVNDGIEL
jgi:hypothetical protein